MEPFRDEDFEMEERRFRHRMLLVVMAVVLVATCLSVAWAEEFESRPTVLGTTVQLLSQSEPDIVANCLVRCGQAERFACLDTGPDQVTNHFLSLEQGAGNVCVQGVTLNEAGAVSLPSTDSKLLLDVPLCTGACGTDEGAS